MYSVRNVADKVALLSDGKIHFTGTPDELLHSDDKVITDFIKRTEI
jgi:ABC-type transporter Mla maintaining outer membrane lipid asymmetry ATPase subunit MlaF